MSTFSFLTYRNQGAQAVIPVKRGLPEGSVFVAEFDDTSKFTSPITAGTVTQADGQLTLQLTAGEVNAVKSGSFRIALMIGESRAYLVQGYVTHVTKAAEEPLDPGSLSNVAMTGDYNDLTNKPQTTTPETVDTKVAAAVQTHINASAPHPVYDDLPSLKLLFENGLM